MESDKVLILVGDPMSCKVYKIFIRRIKLLCADVHVILLKL